MTNELPYQYIVVNIDKSYSKLKNYLEVSWLPTIDIEALLSIIFTVFSRVSEVETTTDRTIQELLLETFEFKDNTLVTNVAFSQYVIKVLQDVVQDIYDELLHQGFLIYETFPYEYRRSLPDGSVVLAKIVDTGSTV